MKNKIITSILMMLSITLLLLMPNCFALEGEDIIKFSYHRGCVNFGVKYVGVQGQARLLELAQQFQMQDVPYGEAYITLPEYLIRCGCYDEVENPNYVPMTEPWDMGLPMDQIGDYLIKYDEWKDSDKSKKTHKGKAGKRRMGISFSRRKH